MNIPSKVFRSSMLNSEAYAYHQNLAKKYYKSHKNKKNKNKGDQDLIDPTYVLFENKNLKEEIFKWFFSLKLEDRIKIVSIDNKWFANMVFQMFFKFKQDNNIRYQFKIDDINGDDYFANQMAYNQALLSYTFNLDTFFNISYDKYISKEKSIADILFLREVRSYSIKESNDTITLSTNMLNDPELFKYYFNTFSNEKCFKTLCS